MNTNINNKTEGIATSGLSKKEHYSWDNLDDVSTHMIIPISKLNVDTSYQRGEASNSSTIQKAKHMQHAAIGAIIVAKRLDGSFWIVDGLQRTLAASKRGDVTEIDCMVFNSHGQDHEAKVFLLCNKGRISVSACHKYQTSVTAGINPESEIDNWLKSNGFLVSAHSGRGCIRFPTKLIQAWGFNKEACKRALIITRQICGIDEINANVFCGVSTLIRNKINVESEVQKIISLGGLIKIQKEINTVAITLGLNKSLKVCGLGVLSVINHKRRKKLSVSQWSE